MKKYRVSVQYDIDRILDFIRHRHLIPAWPATDFYCLKSAEIYAFQAALATGLNCTVKLVDDDLQSAVRARIQYLLGAKQ
jgi:hypothetical protein